MFLSKISKVFLRSTCIYKYASTLQNRQAEKHVNIQSFLGKRGSRTLAQISFFFFLFFIHSWSSFFFLLCVRCRPHVPLRRNVDNETRVLRTYEGTRYTVREKRSKPDLTSGLAVDPFKSLESFSFLIYAYMHSLTTDYVHVLRTFINDPHVQHRELSLTLALVLCCHYFSTSVIQFLFLFSWLEDASQLVILKPPPFTREKV